MAAPNERLGKFLNSKSQSDDLRTDVQRVLLRVAEAAFRRSVDASDVQLYFDLFDDELEEGSSTEEALRTATAAIFCST